MLDTIFIDSKHLDKYFSVPIVPAEEDEDYIKHVHCEGAHFHVLSYTNNGIRCSEPKCIKNKPR